MPATPRQHELVSHLREQLRAVAPARPIAIEAERGCLPTAIPAGACVEFLADRSSGALTLALLAAREARARGGGALVLIDRAGLFYPPGIAWAITPDTILLHPQTARDELWAWREALACPGVSAVVGELARVAPKASRSLQLAAEASGAVGLILRPTTVRGHPSWAHTQFLVTASPGRLRRVKVEVTHSIDQRTGAQVFVEWDDAAEQLPTPRVVPVAA